MTEEQAQQIIRRVEGTWRTDFGKDGRVVWRDRLIRFDFEMAERAVKLLADTEKFPPTVSDVRATIFKLEADARADAPALPEGDPEHVPDWVYVWRWARTGREPPIDAPFPQQYPLLEPSTPYLTSEQWGELREEWIAAGRPGLGDAPSVIAS